MNAFAWAINMGIATALLAALSGCAPPPPGGPPPWLAGDHYTMEYSAGAVLGDALDGDHTGVQVQVKVKGR